MRFIELFAGIGGFRHGLENCGKLKRQERTRSSQYIRPQGDSSNSKGDAWEGNKNYFKCVWANEWDKYAAKIYRKHYGRKELYEGDIREIATETIPDHDFLTAGFPCPSYSIAGKREGFKDPRGLVFFDISRIAKVKQPSLLLLENVKGLLNHEGGETFRIILNTLSELGYDLEWEVFNSKNYTVPQNRERIFIIGHFRGRSGSKIFPLGKTMRTSNEDYERQTAGCITAGQGRTQNDGTYLIHDKRQSNEIRIYKDRSPAVSSYWGLGGGNVPIARQQDHIHSENGILRSLIGGVHGSAKHYTKTMINGKIRRLTPTECERLQGFPDGWTEGISDSQRYKCLGNAVTTNVVEEIGRKILKVIK